MARVKDERFIQIYSQSTFATETQILVDKQTGVNYLFHHSGYAGGLTPLLKADGTPVVTPIQRTYEE